MLDFFTPWKLKIGTWPVWDRNGSKSTLFKKNFNRKSQSNIFKNSGCTNEPFREQAPESLQISDFRLKGREERQFTPQGPEKSYFRLKGLEKGDFRFEGARER